MTCVTGHEYQCHACQAVSIQLHLMHVTNVAVKRHQLGRGGGVRGGGETWCTCWILVTEALSRLLSHLRIKCICHFDWRNRNLSLIELFWYLFCTLRHLLSSAGKIWINLTSCAKHNQAKNSPQYQSFSAVKNKACYLWFIINVLLLVIF